LSPTPVTKIDINIKTKIFYDNILEINEKLKDKMVSKEELESEKELRQKLVDMISGNADRLT
jgi:hypothetical protein